MRKFSERGSWATCSLPFFSEKNKLVLQCILPDLQYRRGGALTYHCKTDQRWNARSPDYCFLCGTITAYCQRSSTPSWNSAVLEAQRCKMSVTSGTVPQLRWHLTGSVIFATQLQRECKRAKLGCRIIFRTATNTVYRSFVEMMGGIANW